MLEVLQFVFSNFWTFAGTTIILALLVKLILGALAILVVGVRGAGNINIS